MIIDIHTHTFPDSLAPRAVRGLADGADMKNYSDGTAAGLMASMARSGVDIAVAAPVVTNPRQTESINRAAYETNLAFPRTGLMSFGGIHPDTEDWRGTLDRLASSGFKGIKLHPLFQGTAIDDPKYLRLIDRAAQLGLIVLIHAGLDPNFPGQELAGPAQILNMLRAVPYDRVILAHLGALGQWPEAGEIYGMDVYIDTACALYPWRDRNGRVSRHQGLAALTAEQFTGIVRRHGVDRVLFGSDSPWTDEAESIELIKNSGLTPAELSAVLGGNGERLLGLQNGS